MRKLHVVEFATLDGIVQAPGSPDEDREGGFPYGGWQNEFSDSVLDETAISSLDRTGAYLFGRKTYEAMAAYWPTAPQDNPFSASLNRCPKYVASRTLTSLGWQNSHLLRGDVPVAVKDLLSQPGGDVTVLGSGDLLATLLAADLVDEYFIVVSPIVLGTGKRLFRDVAAPVRLRLDGCSTTTTGSVMLTYQRA